MGHAATPRRTLLSGLHLLLTYECNYECDHCFVWGGPAQNGTMSDSTLGHILRQAAEPGTIEWIYFEGGEPFLQYGLLLAGVRQARECGFRVGIVSNAHWATSDAEATRLLQPFAGAVEDLSISDDAYHGGGEGSGQAQTARRAAERLGIPVDFICVTGPAAGDAQTAPCQLPDDESNVMFRGRAADRLALRAPVTSWKRFTACPWEDLRCPERVHVDAYGTVHVCQGISIGNLLQKPLVEIIRDYDPDAHPIVGPLLAGGPAELAERYGIPRMQGYADACHLCYSARCALRTRFPKVLVPDQMYGCFSA